jgi:membrane associated rhomboid family serine protease
MPVMSSGPDLYLVCKSCGAEVSPYITECPYCGTRIQKRAPKLDRGGVPRAAKRARSRPSLPRLRPGEIPGIRADRRAWAVWLLVVAPLVITVGIASGLIDLGRFTYGAALDDPWRAFTAPLAYTAAGYEAITLGTIALFGWLLERRHGWWATLLVFVVTASGGAYVAVEVFGEGITRGANGGALGLLAAWAMRDVLGRRRGREDDSDLLGVLAIAVVLILMPLAATEASGIAGIVGGVAGLLLGLVLAKLPER